MRTSMPLLPSHLRGYQVPALLLFDESEKPLAIFPEVTAAQKRRRKKKAEKMQLQFLLRSMLSTTPSLANTQTNVQRGSSKK